MLPSKNYYLENNYQVSKCLFTNEQYLFYVYSLILLVLFIILFSFFMYLFRIVLFYYYLGKKLLENLYGFIRVIGLIE